MEKENLEKEKSVLMGTASNQDNQDGALEITVSGEKYRCLRFSKAKKWGFTWKDLKIQIHSWVVLFVFFWTCFEANFIVKKLYSFWMLQICTCSYLSIMWIGHAYGPIIQFNVEDRFRDFYMTIPTAIRWQNWSAWLRN